jgi:hypothetical protein
VASNAAVAADAPAAARTGSGSVTFIAAHTETIEQGSEEKSSPRSPGESKGIGTNLGGSVIRMEGIASNDKGGTENG